MNLSKVELLNKFSQLDTIQIAKMVPAQKILFINNMDSFAYNLVHDICYLSNAEVKVLGNDISLNEIKKITVL